MIRITRARRSGSNFAIASFAIASGFLAVLTVEPAAAADTPFGVLAACSPISANRLQCNFPALNGGQSLHIQYVSAKCGSTGTAFLLQAFQVVTFPPNSTIEVTYQIQTTNQTSVGGVVTAGSPAELYSRAGSQPRAFIDIVPTPIQAGTICTASLSGLTTP
ncbi:hypothetical protein [Methylocapsa acidiphila]|uniref:hypothetical protein n=1 Tax=Methylocapsa acidiphila TaxID=133552 RepID=UPI00047C4655|nr:hypothetical protein [Methylocapsa acidiphila]